VVYGSAGALGTFLSSQGLGLGLWQRQEMQRFSVFE